MDLEWLIIFSLQFSKQLALNDSSFRFCEEFSWKLYLCSFGVLELLSDDLLFYLLMLRLPKSKFPILIFLLIGSYFYFLIGLDSTLQDFGSDLMKESYVIDQLKEPFSILLSKQGLVYLNFGLTGSFLISSISALSSLRILSLACPYCEIRKSSVLIPIFDRGLRQSLIFQSWVMPKVCMDSSVYIRILARQLIKTVISKVTFLSINFLVISQISLFPVANLLLIYELMLQGTYYHSQTKTLPSTVMDSRLMMAGLVIIYCLRNISLFFSSRLSIEGKECLY